MLHVSQRQTLQEAVKRVPEVLFRTLRHHLLSFPVRTGPGMGLQEAYEPSICEHYLKWRHIICWFQFLLECWWKLKKTCDTAVNQVSSTQSGQLMSESSMPLREPTAQENQPQDMLWGATRVPSSSICLDTCISNLQRYVYNTSSCPSITPWSRAARFSYYSRCRWGNLDTRRLSHLHKAIWITSYRSRWRETTES